VSQLQCPTFWGNFITPSLRRRISKRSRKFFEELMVKGILASIGSEGDMCDDALTASTMGLFKTEAIR